MPDAPTNLVALWIWVETRIPGRHLADAVRELAEEIGRPIRQSRVYEWRDGKRGVSADARRYMMAVVIERAIQMALGESLGTYTDPQLERLVELLST